MAIVKDKIARERIKDLLLDLYTHQYCLSEEDEKDMVKLLDKAKNRVLEGFLSLIDSDERLRVSDVKIYRKGSVKSLKLANPTWINTKEGKMLFKGYIYFYESGELKEGELKREVTIYLPKRYIKEWEFSKFINKDIGYSSKIIFTELFIEPTSIELKNHISFYKNGDLKSGCLARRETLKTNAGLMEFDFLSLHPKE